MKLGMQELIVVQKQDLKEISILEDGVLKEYYKEVEDKKRLEGNIYVGKVTDVLIGMQAAFVDICLLYTSDAADD